ncbi:hypothetical protein AZI85_07380 [Bdellovibrio bacteriovorus]|uniref:Uncharacterized protein n=1 Tax=Bdellovibrio bacteriovorus TaxID=959 RepID=A0A150WFW7_BDEBC|nr:hypothetical protein [Bdellovibrio bacteriovorus]KYG62017.1 hypothetical protein AZI85_07380 [Bdellovibrio bacteriovorus]
MNPFKTTVLSMSLMAALSACAPQKESAPATPDTKQVSMNSDIYVNGEKMGEIHRQVKTQDEIDKLKEKKRSSSLIPLPVSPELSASVFKLTGQSVEDQYLVAPRVFVYSGSRLSKLSKTTDGSVVIPFNIALIDGLSPRIHTAGVSGPTQEIPEALRVKSYRQLHEEVARYADKKKEDFALAAIPGCASKITISAAGQNFDVTPAHLSDSDFCEVNKPFTVNLKVPENIARYILGTALRANMVDVIVNYAVTAPVPVSELSVRFDKQKVYDAIVMNLQASYPPYGEAEVEYAVEKAMKSMKMSIHIQGDYNEQMKLIVTQAIATFFEKMPPNPERPSAGKCQKMVCLTVKQVKFEHQEKFEVQWAQLENMRMEKVFRLTSKLQPVNDEQVTIGKDASIGAATATEFSNKNANSATNPLNVYSVGITPQKGDTVYFRPTLYTWERRKLEQEVQFNSKVWRQCTGRVGIENSCSYTTRHEYWYRKEYLGQDIWVSTVNPLGSIPQFLNGVKLYFRFANGEQMTCPLEDLYGTNEDGRRTIQIENTPNCPLFDVERKVITSFGLINDIKLDAITYTAGERYVTDYGPGHNTYTEKVYSPTVYLAGQLTLLGGSFISGSSVP